MLRPGRAPHSLGMCPGDQWVVITQAECPEPRRRWLQDGTDLRSLWLSWEPVPHPLPGGLGR